MQSHRPTSNKYWSDDPPASLLSPLSLSISLSRSLFASPNTSNPLYVKTFLFWWLCETRFQKTIAKRFLFENWPFIYNNWKKIVNITPSDTTGSVTETCKHAVLWKGKQQAQDEGISRKTNNEKIAGEPRIGWNGLPLPLTLPLLPILFKCKWEG